MESRINELLGKYWEGQTTLDEERELKDHFTNNPSLTAEGQYFRQVSKLKKIKAPEIVVKKRTHRNRWLSVAATLVMGFIAAFFVFKDAQKQRKFIVDDPQKALEITRQALLLVSSELNEGAKHTTKLSKINKAEEILTN